MWVMGEEERWMTFLEPDHDIGHNARTDGRKNDWMNGWMD